MAEKTLPFPRGLSYSDGGLVTMGDATASHLEGKIYEVDDTVHGSGRKILLRCVKNDTGSAITAANKFCEFSTTSARDFGGRVGTFPADTAGAVVKPLDDKYAAGYSIPANDMFYVVEDGLCDVLAEATYNLTAGDPVATDAAGLVNGAQAAAGEYIVGRIDVSGTTGSVNVLVHVAAGLAVGGDLSA